MNMRRFTTFICVKEQSPANNKQNRGISFPSVASRSLQGCPACCFSAKHMPAAADTRPGPPPCLTLCAPPTVRYGLTCTVVGQALVSAAGRRRRLADAHQLLSASGSDRRQRAVSGADRVGPPQAPDRRPPGTGRGRHRRRRSAVGATRSRERAPVDLPARQRPPPARLLDQRAVGGPGVPEVDLQRPLPRQAGDHGLLAAVR